MRSISPHAHRRFALAGTALLCAALAACSDEIPLLQPTGDGLRRSVTEQPAEWRGYWRSDRELWVYDMTPEVGINLAYGDTVPMRRVRNAGMRLVRKDLTWGDWVNCPGCFASVTTAAEQTGSELIVLVHGPRDAAMQLTNPSGPGDRATIYNQLATDMAAMVAQYPTVKFWQLYNEPDATCEPGKFFNGSNAYGNSTYQNPNRYVQGRNYADMLRTVYPAMKQAARNQGREIWVLTAAFTGEEGLGSNGCASPAQDTNQWEFVRGMYENGGKEYFDIFAFHTYGTTAGSYHSILETSSIVNYKMHTEWGDGGRPLWITEFGTSADNSMPLMDPYRDKSQDGAVFDAIQRTWYEEAVGVQRDGLMTQKILGYAYHSNTGGATPGTGIEYADPYDHGLGIFRADAATPRPAYDFLLGRAGINRLAEDRGTRTGVFRITTWGQVPVHHPYHYEGNVMVIENVQVNGLHPTVIPMRFP